MSRGGRGLYFIRYLLRASQTSDKAPSLTCSLCPVPPSCVVSLMSKKDLKSYSATHSADLV